MSRTRRSRREILTACFGAFREARDAASSRNDPDPEVVLRPPGAVTPDESFLALCTGCGDCVPACPAGSIFTFANGEGTLLPGLSPSAKPCYLCRDLPCIAACPDGALVDPGGPQQVRLGIARVDPRRCVTFHGARCDRCVRCCPIPQAITTIGGRPLVASGACTGCGLCEYACPEAPKAIVVIAERHLVPGLRVPVQEYDRG